MIFVTNDDRMGRNIRYLRQKENLSQENLAWLAGIECSSLDAIETGNQPEIDATALMRISRQFQVDIQALVEDLFE